MSKRKKSRSIKRLLRKPSYQVVKQVNAAMVLHEEGDSIEARDQLLDLAKDYPDSQQVVSALAEVCLDLNDWHNFVFYGEKALPFERGRHRASLLHNLVYGHLQLNCPAMVWYYASELIEHHPHHDKLEAIRSLAASTKTFLLEQTAEINAIAHLSEEKRLDIMARHEQVKLHNESDRLEKAVALAKEVLAEAPDLAPVLNNLSLAQYTLGAVDEAIATSQRVLETNPQNFHALGNLVRYTFLSGRFEQAEAYAHQLAQVKGKDPDLSAKQAEAFSFLGDDEQVWAAYERAKALKHEDGIRPLLLHLAAVASYRLGKEKRAWRLWQLAVKNPPRLEMARDCLAEKTLPVGRRSVPWYWPFSYWFPADFKELLSSYSGEQAQASEAYDLAEAIEDFMAERPYFNQLLPHILDRGDQPAREFVLNYIRFAKTPDLLAIMHEFALSKIGKDETRLSAMQFLAQNHPHLLPDNKMVPLWINGEQKELLMLSLTITDKPHPTDLPSDILDKHETAFHLLQEDKLEEAESLLHKIIAAAPDFPAAHNHLAVAYERQGRQVEARALAKKIQNRFPDYLFAQTAVARTMIEEGRLDEAREILNALLSRSEFHISEFQALACAEIDLALANSQPDAAKSWLRIWRQVDPDNPELDKWEMRIEGPPRFLEALRGLRKLALDRKQE